MKERSLKINIILNIIYTLSNMIFPLLTFPYVSRILKVELMGKVNFFVSMSSYLTMLASLGISTYGIRAVARNRNDSKKLTKVTQELFTINLTATIIIIGILVLLCPFIDKFKTETALLFINCILIISTPFGMSWLFSGLEQYMYITKRSLIFKAISLILIFAFVHNSQDYIKYAVILAFSSVASYICNFIYARHFITYKPVKLEIMPHFKPMLLLFASILAINIYTHLDTVMLGFISGDEQVGLYTVAVYAKTALLTMVNAISATLLPRISYYYSQNNETALNNVLQKSITMIFMIALPLSMFFILGAKDVVLILGGNDYLNAVVCMQIIMPVLLISGVSNITGNQILIPLGKDSLFMKAVISGAIIDLILNSLLMPKYGCIGAAIATLFAEFTQMTIQLIYAKEYMFKNINKKSIAKILISTIISLMCVTIIKLNFLNVNALIDIFISAIVFFIIYLSILLVFKEKEIIDIKNQLKNIYLKIR